MSIQTETVAAAVNARLRKSPYWAVRQLSYEIVEDVVILQGHVPTFYAKQQAQEAVRHVQEIHQVVNEVRVDS